MKRKQIDLFFQELDRELGMACDVILTGAVAGALMGHVRPSLDIDFEIRPLARGNARVKRRISNAIAATQKKFGIAAEYSDDIGHWSMIEMLDYRKKAKPYKRIGKLHIRLLAPEHWTIGKLARYLSLDSHDMVRVLKKKKTPPSRLTRLWATALRKSPLSAQQGLFVRHVEDFLKTYGRKIWGRGFDAKAAIQSFRKAARIPS